MNNYPGGMTGAELDDERTLDQVIDDSDRKEIVRMIFEYMTPELEKELLKEIMDSLSPKEAETLIEDVLHEERALTIAKDFIKDNCPNIAE
jgi:hypothetical protein